MIKGSSITHISHRVDQGDVQCNKLTLKYYYEHDKGQF